MAGDYTTIKVGQNIELAADEGDNALVINRPVTISGAELTFRRGGIVLGADVVFEDITLGFPNPVRNAIFANGHTLTLNNVQNSDSCSTSLHVFCGGVTNYNGTNDLPEIGEHGNVIIKGNSELGDILAGSLADDNAANIFEGNATITIDSTFSGTIGNIYAHGAYEPRGTGEGDALSWDTNIDMPYKVSGDVNINVNKLHTLTIDGDTGIDKCASFSYSGSEYVYTPVIKNISQINVNAGHLAPASGSSFKGNNIDISVANGTRLDFSNFGDSVTLNNFSGGGEIVLRQPQTILISGTITGNTSIGIGSITEYEEDEKYSNQRPARRHNYIKAPNANSESYSFSIIPWNKEILKMDANGNWLLPDINIIIQSIDVPEVIELPTETTEVAIPITITYENYDEFDTMLCYMPIAVSINGNQAIINPDQGYGYSYSMQDDIGITPLEFGFDVDENDNDIEVLSLKGTGFEYKIPDGEYIVRFIIPAGNMSSSNETIFETTLKIGHVHSGGAATCVSKAVCSCGEEYGEVDSNAHNYEEDWKSDETQHWHECSLCHEKKDEANHNPGAEATESTAQKCTICEYVIVEALGHTHSGGTATCVSKAVCSCGQEYGEVDSNAHNYEEDWKSDETQHWHECSLCHEKKDEANHNPGAEATESTAQKCTTCEYVIVEALGHTHSGGTATCVSKAVCSCGEEYGELNSNNHTGTTEIRGAVEATSRKNGYTGDTYYKCCNLKIKTGKVIPKTGGSNSGGGGSSSSKSEDAVKDDVSVKTSGKKGSAETIAKTEIEAKDNVANIEISKEIGENIVNQAKNNDSSAIVIKPEIDGFVRKTEISILGSTMKKIKDKTKAELIIETPIATAVLPRKTIKRLADTNDDIKIRIQRYEDNKFELIISIDNKIKNEVAGIELVVPYDDADYGIVAMILNDDGSKEIVKKTTYDDDNVIIPLEGSEKIEIVDNAKDFYDISRDKWHFDAVKFVTSRNLFSGTSDKEFSPNMPMTRGMVAQVLHNFENNPKSLKSGQFYDVREDAWYQSAVSWAVEEGIISGYGDGLFGPKDDVTREQLAVMLWRYSGSPKSNHKLNYFLDKDDISEYAKDALAWANESGIINGKGEKILDPKGKATRAEVAQMLKNMVENN